MKNDSQYQVFLNWLLQSRIRRVMLWALICLLAQFAFIAPARAAATSWTNIVGGAWEDAVNWSNGAPDSDKDVTIGGNQDKLITVGDSAPVSTMTVSNLAIGAGAATTNTVLFNRTDSTPLEVLRSFQLGSGGNGVFVMDTTSSLLVTNPLGGVNSGRIGLANTVGRSGELILSNGSVLANLFLADGATDSQATLRIAGGSMAVTNFQVGSSGTGTVWVTGGQLTVTNAANTATFIIGGGKVGSMTMSGGMVNARILTVGNAAGGVGNVTVAGGQLQAVQTNGNSTVGNNGSGTIRVVGGIVMVPLNLTVGNNNGSSGTLDVQGGSVSVLNNLIVGANATATGQVFVSGTGALFVTNAIQFATLAVGRTGIGAFTMNGGQATLDRLVATNSGVNVPSVALNRGVLNVGISRVVNGLAFVVGNGTDSAALNLVNGGHVFSNGLTIASSATLAGTGTVSSVVTVQNGATLSPGLGGPGTLDVETLILNDTTTLNFDLGASQDLIQVLGDLTLNGTINISDSGGFGIGDYTLMTYAGNLTDNGLVVGSTPDGSLTYTVDTGTAGSVILHVTGGGGDPYTAWTSFYGLSGGNVAGNADPDGDGMSNTNEFLAGFNPTDPIASARIISIARSGNDIVITYRGSDGDTSYAGGPTARTNVLEVATGTANGSYTNNFTGVVQTDILSGGIGLGTNVTVTDSFAATNSPARYYRVRVLAP